MAILLTITACKMPNALRTIGEFVHLLYDTQSILLGQDFFTCKVIILGKSFHVIISTSHSYVFISTAKTQLDRPGKT